jgi:stage II sporulation protein AA (anti-sigma F factor antagonist)
MCAEFSIREESTANERRLVIAGELDLAAGQDLDPAISRAFDTQMPKVVLDLRQVTFMDSMGLRSLLTARDQCAERGIELAVIPTDAVLKVFEVTGLIDEMPWHEPS